MIIFEQRMAGGKRLVYAQNKWPERIEITEGAFLSPNLAVDDNGLVVVRVQNGHATYKLSKQQDLAFGFSFELVAGEWSPIE
jgi:hypothetical protein